MRKFEYADAELIARVAHLGQVDKRGVPYIEHPLAVSRIVVANYGGDEYDRMVGVLHDVIEDTLVSAEFLRDAGCPEEVIEGVVGMSRVDGETYMEFIARAALNPRSRRGKLADTENNSDPARAVPGSESLNKRYAKARKVLIAAMIDAGEELPAGCLGESNS